MTKPPPRLLLRASGLSKSYQVERRAARGVLGALARPFRGPETVEVLKGVDLEIHAGESLGILGRNGAGKTTLLSILGGVVEPTEGAVERFGAVATILGTGERFQSDLTGEENADLFCDTLGLGGHGKAQAMAEIERFAELGDYFRRPLRTYSSGMRGRLGFSCAANVRAELIIVDEILSVGDAEFRLKCLGLMERQQQRGVTYVLVTHSAGAIANMCSRGAVMEGGRKVFEGAAHEGVSFYRGMLKEARLRRALLDPDAQGPQAPIGEAVVSGPGPDALPALDLTHFEHLEPEADGRPGFALKVRANQTVEDADLRVSIIDSKGIGVAGYRSKTDGPVVPGLAPGSEFEASVRFSNRLTPGRYYYRVGLFGGGGERLLHYSDMAGFFDVEGPPRIGLVDLEMAATGLPRPAPSGPRIGFFMHLAGDVEVLSPIVAAARLGPYDPIVVMHGDLPTKAPGARALIEALGAASVVADPTASPRDWMEAAGRPLAWLFSCETTLRPHRPAHELALAARAAGVATVAVQHGYENVGISFFDEIQGAEVKFASERVLTWSPLEVLPAELPPETRAKIVAIGRPLPVPADGGVAAWPPDMPSPDVAVFENIHWHRYPETYRRQFLGDLERICAAFPDRRFLIRPHPQGRWLTERYEGRKPEASNLVVADPRSPEWQPVRAADLIGRAGLVVTTPSTVALDAAQMGAPVALVANDLHLPLYDGLPFIRTFDDFALLLDPTRWPGLRDAGRRFLENRVVPGSAAEKALAIVSDLIATRSNGWQGAAE